jgi:SLOG family YspA-like protein
VIVALTGWRRWPDRDFIWQYLDLLLAAHPGLHLRHGDAPGADEFGWQWRLERGVPGFRYEADRLPSGAFKDPSAGPRRNRQMLLGAREDLVPADYLVAFPQPGVRAKVPGSGSWGCVIEAHVQGIHVDIPCYRKRVG